MSTIRPRTPCFILKHVDGYDRFGKPNNTYKRIASKCAIIHLYDETEKTSVRADSSASRGNAEETVADARLLFKPDVAMVKGDLVEIPMPGDSITIRVTRIFRRIDVGGKPHHLDVEGSLWVSS